MNTAEVLSLLVRRMILAFVLCGIAWSPLPYAQNAPAEKSSTSTASPAQSQAKSPSAQASQQSSPPAQEPDNEKDEVKITPSQAEELFHSVDEILEFDSKQTGLPIKHEVKRRLTSRDEVVSYLTKHVDDEDTQRLRRSELVLKKFGLLPPDFNLETFLVALLREEVAGYYDPKTKTVNLLDWVPMEEQEPVMAHELTHALQDQSFGLQKWMQKGDKDLAKVRRDLTPLDIENDEIDDAREAVVEGQAQAMMFQYAIAPTGRTIVDSPDLVDAMETETMTGTSSTKVFNEAPIFMKESLTFPYSYGMEFVIDLMRKGGKGQAFEGVLKNPPHTTRQIMQPETYLSGERIVPIPVPDFKRDFKDYQRFDVGAMGEFDVAVLVEQYAGKALSKQMYPEWRGGYYYAANPKQNLGADSTITGPLGLLYVSRWSSADAAAEFAGIYAHSLKERYKKIEEVDAAPKPAVNNPVQEKSTQNKSTPDKSDQLQDHAPPAADSAQAAQTKSEAESETEPELEPETKPAPTIDPLKGRHAWATEDGAVVIEEQGDTVLVSESLDPATTATVEKEVFASQPSAK
ncbi:MAG TPA: hypothetical protein VMD99_01410 [Terriglobales bacterium]|nr:hypothetical protein [Terriglobales bacterium]